MSTATFKIWRGDAKGGAFRDYTTEISEGMVVLDAVHDIQETQAGDLAFRWNCKAGKCGSCSAEINGMPKLMCMTRMSDLPLDKPITIEPMKAFPFVKDLITDVSWNFAVKKQIKKFNRVRPMRRMERGDAAGGYRSVQEFRKCIECFFARMFVTCCATIDSTTNSSARGFLSTSAALKCIRSIRRIALPDLREAHGIGFCATSRSAARKYCPESHRDHRQRQSFH